MKALLLDFEATGIDPTKARPIEVAGLLTDSSWMPTDPEISHLIWESGYPALSDEVSLITKITEDDLINKGETPVTALNLLHEYGHTADIVVAYNAKYDQDIYSHACSRHGVYGTLLERPWLCAIRDVPWFDKPKKLMYSALDAGVTVNPLELHRAIADVRLMATMLRARGLDAKALFDYYRTPSHVVKAKVSYDERQLAKDAGYSWENVTLGGKEMQFTKSWVKVVKETNLNEEKGRLFQVEVLL